MFFFSIFYKNQLRFDDFIIRFYLNISRYINLNIRLHFRKMLHIDLGITFIIIAIINANMRHIVEHSFGKKLEKLPIFF